MGSQLGFSSGSSQKTQYFRHHSLRSFTSSQAAAYGGMATNPNMTRGSPPAQHQMQSPNPEFSQSELDGLRTDRKRWLANAYISMGIPLETTYSVRSQGAVGEASTAAENVNSSMETEESNFTVYQSQQSNIQSSIIAQSECCDTCHGPGCKIDHGAIRYAGVVNQRIGDVQYVEVREDTGTKVNWVSPQLVRDCNFPLLDGPEKRYFLDFKGDQYEAKQRVKIPFVGKLKKTEQTEFFVAPASFPVNGLLVGNEFISTFGHPHNVFLDEQDKVLVMVQKKTTESEHRLIQVAQAEADERAFQIEQKRNKRAQQRISDKQIDQPGRDQQPPASSSTLEIRSKRG